MNKKCPYCAEIILKDAKKCKHCGEWLTKQSIKSRFSIKNTPFRNKYYLSWVVSMSVFLFSFVLSENSLLPDYMLYVVLLTCAIAGLISFSLYAYSIIKLADNKLKHISLIIVSILLFFYIGFQDPPVFNNSYSFNERGLRKEIEMLYALKGEDGARNLYRNFLVAESKTMTEDEFVKGYLENESKTPYLKRDIHSIKIEGNYGFVDRTISECSDSSCDSLSNPYRSYKRYVYNDNRWYSDIDSSCPRLMPYETEPEFSRALSLIIQRFNKQEDQMFKEILNCVNIQYSNNDSEIDNAEGIFTFREGQEPLKLDILVSPRYKFTDDLLTAYLISHELDHAQAYVLGWGTGQKISCFETEAMAFNRQIQFISNLNSEEIASLQGRLENGGSDELYNVWNTIKTIAYSKGASSYEKALNYVKSQEYYQKQCAGR